MKELGILHVPPTAWVGELYAIHDNCLQTTRLDGTPDWTPEQLEIIAAHKRSISKHV